MEAIAYVSYCDLTGPASQSSSWQLYSMVLHYTTCVLWRKTLMCDCHLDQNPICGADHVVEPDCI